MADETGTTSRPLKRTCVALAGNSVDGADRYGAVVIGDCISDGAVKRSALLSGIEDAEGLASLPGHLSPEDIRLWETACFVGEMFPTDEVVTVLKVADALGDDAQSIGKWLRMLAGQLCKIDWQQASQADATLTSLLRLPDHLLRDATAACISEHKTRGAACYLHLLASFPPCLHPAIIQSAVGTDGVLQMPCTDPRRVLELLPLLAFPPPGLRGLDVGVGGQDQEDGGTAVPALLARAMSAHPSLTRLTLTRRSSLPPRWLHTFAACLRPGALPCLAVLHLCIDARPSACAELAACLRHLPALAYLDVELAMTRMPAPAEVSLTAYSGLAAAPTALPNLQDLSITEDAPYSDHGRLDGAYSRCNPPLLSLISAPAVTRLALYRPPDIRLLQPLLRHVQRFKRLRELDLSVLLSRGQPAAAGPAIDDLQGELPALETAVIGGFCPASPVYVAAAVATLAAASLTSLTIEVSDDAAEYTEGPQGSAPQAAIGWYWLSPALRQCTRLQKLSLEALGCCSSPTPFSHYFACSFPDLPQLQHLTLTPVDTRVPMRLDEQEIASALTQLTALETLAFHRLRTECQWVHNGGPVQFTFQCVRPVLRALGELKRLTQLTLYFDGVTLPLLAELLEQLPALRGVRLLLEVLQGGGAEGEGEGGGLKRDWDALEARFPLVKVEFNHGQG